MKTPIGSELDSQFKRLGGAVPSDAENRILQSLQASLKPVRPLSSDRVIASQILAAFALMSAVLVIIMRPAGVMAMNAREFIAMSTILGCGALLLAISLVWLIRPGSLQRIPPRAAVLILAAGFLAGIALLFPWRPQTDFIGRGLRCLKAGLIMAIPAAVIFGWLIRRGAHLKWVALGATLGAMAGLLSVTVLQYACDLQNISHLLVWHGAVLVLSTATGVLLGEAVRRFRTSRFPGSV